MIVTEKGKKCNT